MYIKNIKIIQCIIMWESKSWKTQKKKNLYERIPIREREREKITLSKYLVAARRKESWLQVTKPGY